MYRLQIIDFASIYKLFAYLSVFDARTAVAETIKTYEFKIVVAGEPIDSRTQQKTSDARLKASLRVASRRSACALPRTCSTTHTCRHRQVRAQALVASAYVRLSVCPSVSICLVFPDLLLSRYRSICLVSHERRVVSSSFLLRRLTRPQSTSTT
jgi:hypothetical protein